MGSPTLSFMEALSSVLDAMLGKGQIAVSAVNDAPLVAGANSDPAPSPGNSGMTPGAFPDAAPPLASPVGFTNLGGLNIITQGDMVESGNSIPAGGKRDYASRPSRYGSMNKALGIPNLTDKSRQPKNYPTQLLPYLDLYWILNSQTDPTNQLPSVLNVNSYASQNSGQSQIMAADNI